MVILHQLVFLGSFFSMHAGGLGLAVAIEFRADQHVQEIVGRVACLRHRLTSSIEQLESYMRESAHKIDLLATKTVFNNCMEDISYLQRRVHPNASHGLTALSRPSLLHTIERVFSGCKEKLEGAVRLLTAVKVKDFDADSRGSIIRALAQSYEARDELESLFAVFAERQLPQIVREVQIPPTLCQKIFNSPAQVFLELMEGFQVRDFQPLSLCNDCRSFPQTRDIWCSLCRQRNQLFSEQSDVALNEQQWYDQVIGGLIGGTNVISDAYGLLIDGLENKYALRYLDTRMGFTSVQTDNEPSTGMFLAQLLSQTGDAVIELAHIIENIPLDRLNTKTLLAILEAPHPTSLIAPHRIVAITEGILSAKRAGNWFGNIGGGLLGFFAQPETIRGLENTLEENASMAEIIRLTNDILKRYGIPKENLVTILKLYGKTIDQLVGGAVTFLKTHRQEAENISIRLNEFKAYLQQKNRVRNLGQPMSHYLKELGIAWFSPLQKRIISRISGVELRPAIPNSFLP